jgi:hypothetical protein
MRSDSLHPDVLLPRVAVHTDAPAASLPLKQAPAAARTPGGGGLSATRSILSEQLSRRPQPESPGSSTAGGPPVGAAAAAAASPQPRSQRPNERVSNGLQQSSSEPALLLTARRASREASSGLGVPVDEAGMPQASLGPSASGHSNLSSQDELDMSGVFNLR